MNRGLQTLFACWLLCIAQLVFSAPQKMIVSGTATNLASGKIVYREYHDITPQQHSVRYVDLSEKLFATKEMTYRQGFSTPEYKLLDRRFHRTTGSKWQDDHFVVYRQEKSGGPHTKKIPPAADLVIDAGFDYFIRSHWNALATGETLTFSFAVADPLTVLQMKIKEVSADESAIQQKDQQFRYFRVSSNNALIGWAMPEINVAYHHHTQLLQVYQGPSNLTDNNDSSQSVTIRYEYELPNSGKNGENRP